MRIVLLADSSADISIADAKKINLPVLRFPLIVDDEEYLECETITLEDFTQKMYDGAITKTSQPSVGSLLEMWDTLLEEYDHVIYACISKGISGAYQTAMAQSRNYEGRVTVLDTRAVCYPHQIMCLQIQGLIQDGYSPEQIKEMVEGNEVMHALLIPGDLKYLKRGGRISPQAAALASLLKIVPILKVENGEIDVFSKVRTMKKAVDTAIDFYIQTENPEEYEWYVVHADNIQLAEEAAKKLEEKIKQPVLISDIYPVIMAHTGPGAIGIGRRRKLV